MRAREAPRGSAKAAWRADPISAAEVDGRSVRRQHRFFLNFSRRAARDRRGFRNVASAGFSTSCFDFGICKRGKSEADQGGTQEYSGHWYNELIGSWIKGSQNNSVAQEMIVFSLNIMPTNVSPELSKMLNGVLRKSVSRCSRQQAAGAGAGPDQALGEVCSASSLVRGTLL